MPITKRTHSNGSEPWSPYRQSSRVRGTQTVVYPPGMSADISNIPIVIGDWNADALLYEDAPIHGTIYYADVPHNLSSEDAYPVSYKLAGDPSLQNEFIDRQFVNINTVRVWLKSIPSGTITVKVLR